MKGLYKILTGGVRYVTYLFVADVLVRGRDAFEAVGAAFGFGRVLAYAVSETANQKKRV